MKDFVSLKEKGLDPRGAVLLARKMGMKTFDIVAMLRNVYALSLEGAKETLVVAEQKHTTLSEYQATLLPSLRDALEELIAPADPRQEGRSALAEPEPDSTKPEEKQP